MASSDGFFDGTRQYLATEFTDLLSVVASSGVSSSIGGSMAVTPNSGMVLNVASGFAVMRGSWRYETDTTTVTVPTAHATLARFDRVVVRRTLPTKTTIITVKQGTADASPVPPTLQQDSDVWEISLAKIAVAAAATTINSGNITDERTYVGAAIATHGHTGSSDGGTLADPKITSSIRDTNNNELVTFTTTASAVNEVGIKNNTTGNAAEVFASGGDTNRNLRVSGKGTGFPELYSPSGGLAEVHNGTSSKQIVTSGVTSSGHGPAWQSWTPTVTQSGSVTVTVTRGRYCVIGKEVRAHCRLTVSGSGTGSNSVLIGTLPIGPTYTGDLIAGVMSIYDASANTTYVGEAILGSSGTILYGVASGQTGALGVAAFTAGLASSDVIEFYGSWEIT